MVSGVQEGKRSQPAWKPPQHRNDSDSNESNSKTKLRLYNSLTRDKEVFVPKSGSNYVTWYNCGPTVYDASHMGHARTYLSFDILRRVMQNYFKYEIFYVMNITDIDDKIIKRARQNHLFKQYVKNYLEGSKCNLKDDLNLVLQNIETSIDQQTDLDKKALFERQHATLKSTLVECKFDTNDDIEHALESNRDGISDWLDLKFGSEVTENSIFADLPKHWEEEFHMDMKLLNILPADCLTRVSEHIDENIEFIKCLVDEKGMAYESNGSVYFDVNAFNSEDKHFYAKLVPEAAFGSQSASLLAEGEGVLQQTDSKSEKRSPNDFALWKKSKDVGEPGWQSPWGRGRPGWHIECSVMGSCVLGDHMDIHSGGEDLKFPHHDNELAQSEAYHGHSEWVSYFLHSGHLKIDGCKMSKSLKNFISIRDVLRRYSARQLRLLFLLHSWKDTLDYSNAAMEKAVSTEKLFNELFLAMKHLVRERNSSVSSLSDCQRKWSEIDISLHKQLVNCKNGVHEALCDNIDTKTAIDDHMRDLVTATNIYINCQSQGCHNIGLLQMIGRYLSQILSVFGIKTGEIGFTTVSDDDGCSLDNKEDVVMPYLNALSNFRQKVRKLGREMKAKELLDECDKLRDDVLPDIGVRLEDKENDVTVIKLVDREELMKERELKIEIMKLKEEEKERKTREAEEKKRLADQLKKIPPSQMFIDGLEDGKKFSKFDEKGFPTHDIEGEELSKGLIKKLQKLYIAQQKRYDQHLRESTNIEEAHK